MELEFSDRGSLGNSRTNLVRNQSLHKIKPTPVTVTGVSFASTIWLAGGFLLIAGLVVAAAFPNWTSIDHPPGYLAAKNVRIGLFYFCYTPDADTTASPATEECSLYVYPTFKPSNLTNIATIDTRDMAYLLTSCCSYGFGTGLLMIALIVGIIAYCKPRIKEQSLFLVAFVIQLFGCEYTILALLLHVLMTSKFMCIISILPSLGIFLLVSMILFPFAFSSEFMKQFCGSGADIYMRGKCAIEWATQLAMVLVCLTFYLPPFAIFSMNVSDGLKAYNCC